MPFDFQEEKLSSETYFKMISQYPYFILCFVPGLFSDWIYSSVVVKSPYKLHIHPRKNIKFQLFALSVHVQKWLMTLHSHFHLSSFISKFIYSVRNIYEICQVFRGITLIELTEPGSCNFHLRNTHAIGQL